jgi:hypothetical protein
MVELPSYMFGEKIWPVSHVELRRKTPNLKSTRHALPFYALQAATPVTALWLFQGWLPTGMATRRDGCPQEAACGRLLHPWTPLAVHLYKLIVKIRAAGGQPPVR